MFQFLARSILRYRVLILVFLGVFTCFMFYKATFVELSYKPTPLLPKEDSVLIRSIEFSKKFGKGENIMVIGVQDTTFFSAKHFEDWIKLETDLKRISGVEQVFSLVDAINLVKDTVSKKFIPDKIFKEKAYNQKDLDSIATLTRSLTFYKNLLYNDSTKTYLMLVTLNRELIQKKERVGLVNNIVSVCKVYESSSNNKLYYSGLPYIKAKVGEMIKGEMYLFVALAVIVTSIILLLLFRSIRIVLVSLLIVGIGVVWALGTLSLFGYDLTLLTAVIPTLLVIIGVPSCIFFINKYHHEYRHHGNKIKSLYRVVTRVGSATFLSNLTTAIGFGAFIITNTQVLKEFGVVASLNVMGVYSIALMLIPIIFSFMPPPETKHLTHLSRRGIKKNINRIVVTVLYRRKFVFAIAIVLICTGFVGVTFLKNNGYMVDDIPRNHPVLVNLKFFEKNFNGVMPLEIVYDTQKPNGYLSSSVLVKIDRLQKKLTNYPELSKPVSIVEASKFASQAYYNGNPDRYRLPSAFEWGFIMSYIPRSIGVSDMFAKLVDSTGRYVRVMYNADDIGTIRMNNLNKTIRSDIDTIFKENANHVYISGSSIVVTKGYDYLVDSLFVSLPLAIGLISIFMAWMFRKWRIVMFSVLTNMVPLLLTSAAMGYIGIALKPSTVIVFSIAFGIAIDNSIQLLAKYRQELRRTSHNIKASVIYAIRETGISIIYTSIVLFFGFGVFSLSKFGGTVSLGVLVALTLLIALFSNLFILPSILLSFERSTTLDPDYEPALELSAGFDDEDENEAVLGVEDPFLDSKKA
jgi:predicted RND superfamily exporter protein